MPQLSFTDHYCRTSVMLSISALLAILLAMPVLAVDMSGWSDKSVCRLVTATADNAVYLAEAQRRKLDCGTGAKMSGGEQQMLTVARSLMGNPLLLLLDEPSEGVAPVIVEHMAQMILALKAEGVSILLSEQNMHFAELVSDRAYVLEKGQICFDGSMAELSANEEVRRNCIGI